ncbi:MAG: hypothetical protein RL642_298 [Bacteroidota bacterium]
MSDVDRVLKLFRGSNGRLISSGEIIDAKFDNGKRIVEYTGRITDARERIKCSCGKDPKSCYADEHILNVKNNWYQYRSRRKVETIPILNLKPDYVKQREDLLEEYKKESDPMKKEIIKQRGLAVSALLKKQDEDDQFVQSIGKALL